MQNTTNRTYTVTALLTLLLTLTVPAETLAQQQWKEWFQNLSGQAGSIARNITHDRDGNIFISGDFKTTIEIDGKTYTASGNGSPFAPVGALYFAKLSPRGVRQYVTILDYDGERLYVNIATDATGNLYAMFSLRGTGKLINDVNGTIEVGNPDNTTITTYLLKLSPEGHILRVQPLGEGGFLNNGFIACSGDDAVYLTASFADTIIIGDSTYTTGSRSNQDIVLMKMDTAGTVRWVRVASGTGLDAPSAMTTDTDGNCYALWSTQEEFTVGGSTFTGFDSNHPDSIPYYDIILVKYSPEGDVLIAEQFGSRTLDPVRDILVRRSGDIVVCGGTNDTAWFPGLETPSVGSRNSMYLAQFNPQGQCKTVTRFADPDRYYSMLTGLAEDMQGRLYAVGTFTAWLTLNSETIFASEDSFYEKGLLIRFNTEDRPDWYAVYAGDPQILMQGLIADAQGGITILGNYSDVLTADDDGSPDILKDELLTSPTPFELSGFLIRYATEVSSTPHSIATSRANCSAQMSWLPESGTTGLLRIHADQPMTARLTIYSVTGENIGTFLQEDHLLQNRTLPLDLSAYSSGQYFLLLEADGCAQTLPIQVVR